jgi:hypothetical protein
MEEKEKKNDKRGLAAREKEKTMTKNMAKF